MSDTSNLYNDMRNLIHFLPFICSGYPWRAIGNTLTVLQHRKYPIIHSLRSENVATDSKNKETIASLFFSRCQRSKVIFRVTQKSLRILLTSFRKPCSARLPTTPPAPDGCIRRGRLKPMPAAPDGCSSWAFGWSVPVCVRYAWSKLSDGQCSLVLSAIPKPWWLWKTAQKRRSKKVVRQRQTTSYHGQSTSNWRLPIMKQYRIKRKKSG